MNWIVGFRVDVSEGHDEFCILDGEFFLDAPDIDSVIVCARNKIAKMTDKDLQITKIERV